MVSHGAGAMALGWDWTTAGPGHPWGPEGHTLSASCCRMTLTPRSPRRRRSPWRGSPGRGGPHRHTPAGPRESLVGRQASRKNSASRVCRRPCLAARGRGTGGSRLGVHAAAPLTRLTHPHPHPLQPCRPAAPARPRLTRVCLHGHPDTIHHNTPPHAPPTRLPHNSEDTQPPRTATTRTKVWIRGGRRGSRGGEGRGGREEHRGGGEGSTIISDV